MSGSEPDDVADERERCGLRSRGMRRAGLIALCVMLTAAWYAWRHASGTLERDWWVPIAILVLVLVLGGGAYLGSVPADASEGPGAEDQALRACSCSASATTSWMALTSSAAFTGLVR